MAPEKPGATVSKPEKAAGGGKPGRRPVEVSFPRDSLKKAFRVAESIEKNSAGRPYNRLDLAQSIELSPNSYSFRSLLRSSGRYGLTEGGEKADKIALTPLGTSVVAPQEEGESTRGLREALIKPPLFKRILEFYDQKRIPPEDLFKNALKREFGVPPEDVDACYDVLMANLKDYDLVQNIKGTDYLKLERLAPTPPSSPALAPEEKSRSDLQEETPAFEERPGVVARTSPPAPVPRAFVSHSKNKRIVGQIKEILDFGQFDHRIAVETETTAIPIPDKVFGLMRDCNCAIINVSADETEKRDDDTYGVNPNVLIEIGGAFLAYNKRVILLADRRVKLPSNLQGLAVLYYEGDELDFETVMKLQKTLTQFRKGVAG